MSTITKDVWWGYIIFIMDSNEIVKDTKYRDPLSLGA